MVQLPVMEVLFSQHSVKCSLCLVRVCSGGSRISQGTLGWQLLSLGANYFYKAGLDAGSIDWKYLGCWSTHELMLMKSKNVCDSKNFREKERTFALNAFWYICLEASFIAKTNYSLIRQILFTVFFVLLSFHEFQ